MDKLCGNKWKNKKKDIFLGITFMLAVEKYNV